MTGFVDIPGIILLHEHKNTWASQSAPIAVDFHSGPYFSIPEASLFQIRDQIRTTVAASPKPFSQKPTVVPLTMSSSKVAPMIQARMTSAVSSFIR
jgi:hypothetical protein